MSTSISKSIATSRLRFLYFEDQSCVFALVGVLRSKNNGAGSWPKKEGHEVG